MTDKVLCCICFEMIERENLIPCDEDGGKMDVCIPCGKAERAVCSQRGYPDPWPILEEL